MRGSDVGADRGDERFDAHGIELGPRALLQLEECLALADSSPVRAVLAHREVRVGNRHDSRGERDLLAGQAAWIPAAVPALVVPGHHLGDVRVDRPADDALSFQRVLADEQPLPLRQGRRLREDVLVDLELPDVMEERSLSDCPPGLVIYVEGRWGARIEDIVAVTADGVERFNTRPTELVVL